ncbi:MAG: GDSL-type esterase/lipase family protein [Steroidobacteraceae bacterium]
MLLLPALCGRAHAQIVAFGASNVAGKNVAAREAFPAQLRAMLREKGYTVAVLNAGISGNTTAEMRKRVDTDIPEGTAIVILDSCGGYHNDEQKGISRNQGDADMAAIDARLKERGIKVVPVGAADLGKEYRQQDGLHLTREGYKLLARQLLPRVTEVLGPPTGPPLSVREACAADARRLCANALGDDAKRHSCMQEHRSELSKDCLHAIVESRRQ